MKIQIGGMAKASVRVLNAVGHEPQDRTQKQEHDQISQQIERARSEAAPEADVERHRVVSSSMPEYLTRVKLMAMQTSINTVASAEP